jgi:hypothetical protein
MAIQMISNRMCPHTGGYRREFICDTDADVKNLPACCAGSSALVLATGKIFVVNASGNWVEFGGEV